MTYKDIHFEHKKKVLRALKEFDLYKDIISNKIYSSDFIMQEIFENNYHYYVNHRIFFYKLFYNSFNKLEMNKRFAFVRILNEINSEYWVKHIERALKSRKKYNKFMEMFNSRIEMFGSFHNFIRIVVFENYSFEYAKLSLLNASDADCDFSFWVCMKSMFPRVLMNFKLHMEY